MILVNLITRIFIKFFYQMDINIMFSVVWCFMKDVQAERMV